MPARRVLLSLFCLMFVLVADASSRNTTAEQQCAVCFLEQPPRMLSCYPSNDIELVCTIRYQYSGEASDNFTLVWFSTVVEDGEINSDTEQYDSDSLGDAVRNTTAHTITQTLTLFPEISQDPVGSHRVYWCQVYHNGKTCQLPSGRSNMLAIKHDDEQSRILCGDRVQSEVQDCCPAREQQCDTPSTTITSSLTTHTTMHHHTRHLTGLSSNTSTSTSKSTSKLPAPSGVSTETLAYSTIVITGLSVVLAGTLVMLAVVCGIAVCLAIANKNYRQQQHQRSQQQDHTYNICVDVDSKQLPLYLSPAKLHTQPSVRKPVDSSCVPVYEELQNLPAVGMTHSGSLYQSLSTQSQDYMTVYSNARKNKMEKEEEEEKGEEEEEEEEDETTFTELSADCDTQQDHNDVTEPSYSTILSLQRAEPVQLPQVNITTEDQNEAVSEDSKCKKMELLKKGLKIQYSTASGCSMEDYVSMKPLPQHDKITV